MKVANLFNQQQKRLHVHGLASHRHLFTWVKEWESLKEAGCDLWKSRYWVIAGLGVTALTVRWLVDLQEAVIAHELPRHTTENVLDEAAVRHLETHGYCYLPRAVRQQQLEEAVEAARAVEFHACTGAPSIRQDQVGWMGGPHEGALRPSLELVRGVSSVLERNCSYSRSRKHKVPVHCQLAKYDGNRAGYRLHRDNANHVTWWEAGLVPYLVSTPERRRCLTSILYLSNTDKETEWDCGVDGGALLLYLGTEGGQSATAASRVVRVEPKGGGLLIFDTILLHEVLPTHRPGRIALTSWAQGDRS